MRHLPDGCNKWILHCVDHWSKFNFAYPLESKRASCVAVVLTQQLFPYFGVPRILHSDNGREFVNSIIKTTLDSWQVGMLTSSSSVAVLNTPKVRVWLNELTTPFNGNYLRRLAGCNPSHQHGSPYCHA